MRVGEIVEVYHDTLTRQRSEGQAELVYLQDDDCGVYEGRLVQRWLVQFVGDLRQYSRTILSDTVPEPLKVECADCGKSLGPNEMFFCGQCLTYRNEGDRDLTPCSFCKKRVREDELNYASFVRESACRDCYRKLPVEHPLRVALGATE